MGCDVQVRSTVIVYLIRPRLPLAIVCLEIQLSAILYKSTDHELIPARNASLAAMQGSTSRSNVR
jgi:hypothetical protein